MSELVWQFEFNTPLISFGPQGPLDGHGFNKPVTPFRERIVDYLPQLRSCSVTRDGVRVSYVQSADITEAEVVANINDLVNWAARLTDASGKYVYFPQRGTRTPVATPSWGRPIDKALTDWVRMQFNCIILPLVPDGKGGIDSERLQRLLCPVVVQLVNHPGVVGYEINQLWVKLTYRADQTTQLDIIEHAETVLTSCANDPTSEYFKHLGDRPLELTTL